MSDVTLLCLSIMVVLGVIVWAWAWAIKVILNHFTKEDQ